MNCPNCGKPVQEGFIVCGYCGASISQKQNDTVDCKKCGKPIPADVNKCPYCVAHNSVIKEKEKKKHSKLSVWAIVLSFFGCTTLFGLICAIVDLAKSKKDNCKHIGSYVAIVFFIINIIFAYNLFGQNSSDDSGTASSSTEVETSNEKSKDDKKANDEEKEQTVFNLGETCDIDGVQFTFSKLEPYSNEYLEVKKGEKYIQVRIDVENTSDDDYQFNPYDFQCYADDECCDQALILDDSMSTKLLSSGKKAHGQMIFEVPKDAKNIILEYETNIFTDNKVTFVLE